MDNIVDLTIENFQPVLIETSQEKFVLVDFWADWSEPSKEVLAILERIVSDYAEHLVLAKVNCDAQKEIAAQFGVRDIPTAVLVKNGQPVDGFAGMSDEAQIREFLQKHLPKVEDGLVQQAAELIATGDYIQAYPLAKQAFELDSTRADIRMLFADCCIEQGQVDQGKALLSEIGMVDQDAQYQALLSKIELAEKAAESPEILALQAKLKQEPDNLDIKIELAIQLHQANKSEDALNLLWSVLVTDLNYGEAKKTMLDMINALPDGDALKSQFRRKIYSLLY